MMRREVAEHISPTVQKMPNCRHTQKKSPRAHLYYASDYFSPPGSSHFSDEQGGATWPRMS